MALAEQPSLTLAFYSFGVMLRKTDGSVTHEYPVDPAQIALALAAKVTLDTGLLGGNTLLIRQDGVKRTVVEYRPPQKTSVYLEGSETALRVPLPGLVMIRTTTDGSLHATSLAEDWQSLLGSPFGDHATSGKSKREPRGIRKLLIELKARKAQTYPMGDLVPLKKTLAQVLEEAT